MEVAQLYPICTCLREITIWENIGASVARQEQKTLENRSG